MCKMLPAQQEELPHMKWKYPEKMFHENNNCPEYVMKQFLQQLCEEYSKITGIIQSWQP